jgi:hypothetical protein
MDEQTEAAAVNPADLPPLTNWAKEPKLTELKQDLEDALPIHQKQVTKIDAWLDNLHVRNGAKPKPVKGRSSIQPKLIRKQAEWRYPALSEPFLSTDDLFNVSPTTWEDRDAAISWCSTTSSTPRSTKSGSSTSTCGRSSTRAR